MGDAVRVREEATSYPMLPHVPPTPPTPPWTSTSPHVRHVLLPPLPYPLPWHEICACTRLGLAGSLRLRRAGSDLPCATSRRARAFVCGAGLPDISLFLPLERS